MIFSMFRVSSRALWSVVRYSSAVRSFRSMTSISPRMIVNGVLNSWETSPEN